MFSRSIDSFDIGKRFISSIYPTKNFKKGIEPPQDEEVSLRTGFWNEDFILSRGVFPLTIATSDFMQNYPKRDAVEKTDPPNSYSSTISNVLGLQQCKVLNYSDLKIPRSNLFSIPNLISNNSKSLKEQRKKLSKVINHVPYRVLDAPGLRNDFYSNLVSWSCISHNVAVGLGNQVYLWNEDSGVTALNMEDDAMVTSVAFSLGDYVLVGTHIGRVWLFSQKDNTPLGSILREGTRVCCLQWSQYGDLFYLGDSSGAVGVFEIVTNSKTRTCTFRLRSTLTCHKQQVCGIALNKEEDEISIGGNDNYCSVWDISDKDQPILKYILPHKAAIKAISYCPWSKSLLSTGGGTKDRTIRFWHTNSGTLLHEFDTKSQVTSLIWSNYSKELVATFGFGDEPGRLLLAGYSYPKMNTLFEVTASSNLRILSAARSPDEESLCVATNDETVRFYKIWKRTKHCLGSSPEAQGSGTYGSSLIELHEGIQNRDKGIR